MSEICTLPGLPGPRLVYSGTPIGERGETLCLTDMWRAAGSIANREPWNWARFEGKPFVEFIAENLNLSSTQVWNSERGQHGGTWAHWQIGMAYAKYLSHEFHAWCNVVVRAHMEGRGLPVQATRGAITLNADDLERFARTVGESAGESAIRAARVYLAEDVKQAMAPIERRLEVIERNQRRRRCFTQDDKRILAAETERQGGICPCCRTAKVIIDGRIANAHYDHMEDVGDASFTSGWLICIPCHRAFKPNGPIARHERRSRFDAFQDVMKHAPGYQLKLIA